MEKGKRCSAVSRGQATLFGFKKPAAANVAASPSPPAGSGGEETPTQPTLPSVPASVVTHETIQPLVIAPVQPRQGTPRLGRAKKDGGKTANRFGFRPPTSMSNKVADMQQSDSRSESDFRQASRPHSVPALKLSARSSSETRFNNKAVARGTNVANGDQTSTTQGYQQRPGKYALQTTQLPQPQNAYFRPFQTGTTPNFNSTANGTNPNDTNTGPVADKWAKTKANNQKAAQSKQFQPASTATQSSTSPANDSGANAAPKSRRYDSVIEIQQLEHSPNMSHKYRNIQQQQQRARPLEMIFTDCRTKRFELREVTQVQPVAPTVMATTGPNSVTHIAGLPTQQSPHQQNVFNTSTSNRCQPHHPRATSSSSGDEGFDEVSNGEEKQNRDKLSSEKIRLGCSPDDDHDNRVTTGADHMDGEDEETLWGRGEAMALDDQIPCANIADIDQSPESTTPRLRSVLLTIEDTEFTSLAVLAQTTSMLEDEVSPDSPDVSCSSPSSVEPLPPPPNLAETPGSPGTPTHATNSLSSDTKDRDFLIDDEIADQPGLVFDTEDRHRLRHDGTAGICAEHEQIDVISALAADDTSILDTSRTISKLAGEVSQALANMNGGHPNLQFISKHNRQQCSSITSLNTLSPCESIASDDLIADFDLSAPFDDLNELDDVPLKSEILTQSDQVLKEWTSLLSSHPGLNNGTTSRTPSKPIRPRIRSTSSGSASPSSIPQLQTRLQANTSNGDDISIDSGIKVDRDKLEQMAHEVVNIKSMLLKLKRVLEETDSLNLNPFDAVLNNSSSLYAGLAASEAAEAAGEGVTSPQLADLQRQIVLLSAQLEERDSRIERLEEALKRSNEARPPPITSSIVRTNIATQTDRIRPLSTGPTLFQTSPDNTTTSFVSGNEKSPTISCQVLPMYSTNKRFNAFRASTPLKHSYK